LDFFGLKRPLPGGSNAKGVRLNERGNAFLQVISIMAALVLGIYFLADRVNRHKQVVMQTSSVLKVRFALHSVMDYMYYTVQRRYCMDDALLESPKCELATGVEKSGGEWLGRSYERVLMSDEQAANLESMICGNNINMGLEAPLTPGGSPCKATKNEIRKVGKLDITLPAKNITALHPLYPVIEPLLRTLKAEFKGTSQEKIELNIHVTVARDGAATTPTSGSEVFFTVKVSFEDQSKKVLVVGRNTLTLTSYGTMFPREVGSFALMTARDLRLDKNSFISGDVSIPPFAGSSTAHGLVFKSPVFVNQNVHLPASDTTVKAAVTFGDRLILGNGWIYDGDGLYKPKTAGGASDVLWTSNKSFGGFKAGVLIDNAYDAGLLAYGGVVPSVLADKSAMEACIARDKKGDAREIMKSELYGNLQPGSVAPEYRYVFGLTANNAFNPQNSALPPVSKGDWKDAVRASGAATNGAVIDVVVRMGSTQIATAQLTRTSTLTLTPTIGKNSDGTDWGVALQAIIDANTDATSVADATARLAVLTAARTNPGSVKITVAPMIYGEATAAKPQEHLLDIKVTVDKPETFFDGTGGMMTPRVQVQAFDSFYNDGALIADSNPKTLRFLNFTRAGDNTILAPPNMSAADAGAPMDGAPFAGGVPNYDKTDFVGLDKKCTEQRNAASGQSFGAAAWNFNFANEVRSSWMFANPTKNTSSMAEGGYSADVDFKSKALNFGPLALTSLTSGPVDNKSAHTPFRPYSIMADCTISAGAELVAGFYVCDELIIEARTKPLTIVGTFIVKGLDIKSPETTLKAGIDWMSIYHPEATGILRRAGVLKPLEVGMDCQDEITSKPIWAASAMSLKEYQHMVSCNVSSLRATAQPFQWTAVDPDCGFLPGTTTSSCKNHPLNFFVMEHGRGGGP
jgi:hypothetical protein